MKIIPRNKKDKPRGENNCINNILVENKKDNKRGEYLRELTNFNQLSSASIERDKSHKTPIALLGDSVVGRAA